MDKYVLFINHKVKNCGIHQYGKRLFNILQKSRKINYIYAELENIGDYYAFLHGNKNNNVVAIIYNYCEATLPWLTSLNIQKIATNIGLHHENTSMVFFDVVIQIYDEDENKFSIPRPLFENVDEILANEREFQNAENIEFIKKHQETINDIPIFGSFGFGFENKGFEKIISYVNAQYDNAIIKFVIPTAHFDPEPYRALLMKNNCLNVAKKVGIQVLISNQFFSTGEILSFLKSNTMNIFMYDTMVGRGPSSTIDYAVSVKNPIAISDSYMFRHIYQDDICLYKNNIQYCLEHSQNHINHFLEKNSNQNLIKKMDTIVLRETLKTFSQACQDIFVLSVLKEKKNGYFLEIGSNHPSSGNNSFILEKKYGWKGMMVEYDKSFEASYKTQRTNSVYEINDARLVDYYKTFKKNEFPNNMDYLQIDLDVNNKSTLETLYLLNKTIFDEYKFATITFEHDIYTGNYFDTRELSRKLLKNRGYLLVFPDVCVLWEGTYKPFEDWYVHPDLVDMEYINKVKSDSSLNFEQIKERLIFHS
jgi:hypothetical protein